MRKLVAALLLSSLLPVAYGHAADDVAIAEQSTEVLPTRTLGDILQLAVDSSDDLGIIKERIDQARSAIGEARSNYYPQITVSERAGRDSAYPSSARAAGDPRGTSEYVNANTTKLEVNQMVFDGFKTPAEIIRQQKLLQALHQRYNSESHQVILDTLDVYLTAWRHLQALRAGVAMVEDMRRVKAKVDMQAAAGATDQTVKSYVDSRLTGATQELLKTRNAYREALFRLGYMLRQQIAPESFGFAPLMAPTLQDIDTYIAIARTQSPQVLEELANMSAAKQELRKVNAAEYPTLSLTSDMQDSNDVGGSIGTVRTGNAMVQVSYKLFDGFATRHGRARVHSQITESEFRLRKTSRQLEEDLSQAWRKAIASKQEAQLATEEAQASLKVKILRGQDVESGSGDIVRLVEAEEALYTGILHQLDLVQTVTQKRYEISISSGQLKNLKCVDGGCEDFAMEPVTYVNPTDTLPEKTTTDQVSATTVVSTTAVLLPSSTTPPAEPIAEAPLNPDASTTEPTKPQEAEPDPATPETNTPAPAPESPKPGDDTIPTPAPAKPSAAPASDETPPVLPPEDKRTPQAPLPEVSAPEPVTPPEVDSTAGNPVVPDVRQDAAEPVPAPQVKEIPARRVEEDTPHDWEAPAPKSK